MLHIQSKVTLSFLGVAHSAWLPVQLCVLNEKRGDRLRTELSIVSLYRSLHLWQ